MNFIMPVAKNIGAPLRESRRDFTRRHICLAANDLFVQRGFAATTMEEIARAAGIQRSTLYNHYKDKEAILGAIADDFIVDVRRIIALLPGPEPSLAEITRWIESFAEFVMQQPGPTELIMALSVSRMPLAVTGQFGEWMMASFAERLPAFARAMAPDQGFALAWAHATLAALGTALTQQAHFPVAASTSDRLKVAAMLFSRFVTQQSREGEQ